MIRLRRWDAPVVSKPSYLMSLMEFESDKVARETHYFAAPFVAPAFRAQCVKRTDA